MTTSTWDPAEHRQRFNEWLRSLTPADYVRYVLLDNARDTLLDRLSGLGDGAPAAALLETVEGDCGTVRFTLTLEVVPTGLTMAEWEAQIDASDPFREDPSPGVESAPSRTAESGADQG